MDPSDTYPSREGLGDAASSAAISGIVGFERADIPPSIQSRPPRLGPIMSILSKPDAMVETPERETPPERIRDSWVSFASTNDGRASLVPSIFSKRGSTRYSVRQDSMESPVSVISPLSLDQRKDSIGNDNVYACTFCEAEFSEKRDWKEHETALHGIREHFPCTLCPAAFSQLSLLVAHGEQEHGISPGHRAPAEPDRCFVSQSAWGCGFCAAYFSSKEDYLGHVDDHYEGGQDRSHWEHSFVIKALLHQPIIESAWASLVNKEEQERGAVLRFYWDPSASNSSDTTDSFSLRHHLEFFATGKSTAAEVVDMAFRTAQKRTEVTVSHFRPRVFAQNTGEMFANPSLVQPKGQGLPKSSEGLDPATLTPSGSSEPQMVLPLSSTPSTFASLTANKRAVGNVIASSKILARVGAVPPRSSLVPANSSKNAGQLMQGFQQPVAKHGFGALRRTDSNRNLGVLSNKGTRGIADTPRNTASHTTLDTPRPIAPPVLVDDAADQHPGSSTEHSLISPRGPGLVAPAQQSPESSVRTYFSSSTLSNHTRDTSTWVDDSTSEMVSDENLSETDSWLPEESSAGARAWRIAFRQSVDRGMGALWARYNLHFTALIREHVGGQRSGHSPQSWDSSGRVHKGTPSRYGAARGLRPPSRSVDDEDEDDDDDGDGYRPSSSLSKNSPGSTKRFACPFRKHDPSKYNIQEHEVCAVRSWSAISRLKEHLYRRHYKMHCQNCKETFSDARDLAEHEMMVQGCEISDRSVPSDITSYQEKQLKSRKHNARRRSDEEKWCDIYGLLFPNEPIPSPYPEATEDLRPSSAEAQSSLQFQHFLLNTMPQLFTQSAEEYFGQQIQSRQALSMEIIPDLIQSSLRKAFKAWESGGNDSEVSAREASIALGSFQPELTITTPPHTQSSGIYQTPPMSATMPVEQSNGNFEHMGRTDIGFASDMTQLGGQFSNETFLSPVTSAGSGYNNPCGFTQYQGGDWDGGLGLVNNSATHALFTDEGINMMSQYRTYHQG